ncbi:hypothetical protein SCLARK_00865 [Spiroplasma clarkii]|uniref:S1 motif domain-containing protein n=1 Tax=Spiroplasma clarkii TaxID=2139 RepID=A0A1Y0L176_9MOLU|nr:S1 RNA-binding domain-containing protein [Spiroplasma clarkii]ARU91478.1 hypothetical protein SCLARK_00865 [Spiroplasma clarkii]ATX70898.1 hypothetical protein SCLAR_v1c05790 [Spiroplasma clarkii]
MGQTVKVTITNLANFGAFCDAEIDGKVYKGLIHITEITNGFVSNIADYVNVGDVKDGYVISVDEEKNQAKISLKRVNA